MLDIRTDAIRLPIPPSDGQHGRDHFLRDPVAHDASWNAGHDGVGRHILGHHRAGGHHTAVTKHHGTKNPGSFSDPDIVLDGDTRIAVGTRVGRDFAVFYIAATLQVEKWIGRNPGKRMVRARHGHLLSDRTKTADRLDAAEVGSFQALETIREPANWNIEVDYVLVVNIITFGGVCDDRRAFGNAFHGFR